MVRSDPADAARAIATDLHAELAVGGVETERALARFRARQLESRDLDALAAAMRRAELIRERTRAAVSDRVSKSLNTTIAIHPDTLRRAAMELIAAELALEAAVASDARRSRLARRGSAGSAMALVGAGAGLAALVAPPVGAAVAAVGIVGGSTSWRRARRKPAPTHASLRGHCQVARSRWEQVAGVGANPLLVESVIHRYDPHDPVVGSLVESHPAVRATERVAVERRLAWVTAWRAEVGDESPITDPALVDLLHRDRTELWLGASSPFALEEPETLVVAAPYADLPEPRARELHSKLLAIPRGQRVIVVLAPDPDAPSGVQLPGVGWVAATELEARSRVS